MNGQLKNPATYYLVANENEAVSADYAEATVSVRGKHIPLDYVLVVVAPYEGSTSMYSYMPNNRKWLRNTALEDDYWGLNIDFEDTLFEEVDEETALAFTQGMRNFSDVICDAFMREVKGDILELPA